MIRVEPRHVIAQEPPGPPEVNGVVPTRVAKREQRTLTDQGSKKPVEFRAPLGGLQRLGHVGQEPSQLPAVTDVGAARPGLG